MTVMMRLDPAALQYRTEIRPEPAPDGGIVYIAEIPDLPGCMSHGSTVDEARQNLEDAKREYLAALEERQLPIPPPSAEPVVGAVTWTIVTSGAGLVEALRPDAAEGSLRLTSRTDALAPA